MQYVPLPSCRHEFANNQLTPLKAQIQARYNTHRENRNAQQRAKLLAPEFSGVTPDEILARLEDPSIEPGFKDWRHCLVFWARPPQPVRSLIAEVQRQLLKVAPSERAGKFDSLDLDKLTSGQACGLCPLRIYI